MKDFLVGTVSSVSWGSSSTSSGKKPLKLSSEIMRELLFNTVFFESSRLLVCSFGQLFSKMDVTECFLEKIIS